MSEFSPALMWLMLGLMLLGLELLTGTFVILLFAVSAFVTAFCVWVGITSGLATQTVVFGICIVVGILLFKEKIKAALSRHQSPSYKGDVGEVLKLETDIAVGGQEEVNYQGAKWTLVNQSGRLLTANESVKIARVEGIKLIVQ